jgi:hypothetical protein
MLRFTALCLCAGLVLAQAAPKKPPKRVDEALRARASEFFQDFVDGNFRKAEALVAEDSKDTYYNAQKAKYRSYELKDIQYSDHFTRAKVTAICETEVTIVGFAGQVLKVPVGSNWKLENGEWYWYIDPDELHKTPFGVSHSTPGARPSGPPVIPTDAGFAMHKIKPDKSALTLKAGESGEVTLTNTAPGKMGIALTGQIPDVDAKLDHPSLEANEKATLSIQTHPGAHSGTLTIQVDPTNETIPIQINIE